MAIAFADLTEGAETTTEPSVTASITPTANAHVYAAVLVALGSGAPHVDDTMVLTGNGLTWNEITRVIYATRRALYVFRAVGAAPSAGTVTIDFTSGDGSTWTEHMWSIAEFTGVNAADPDDAPTTVTTTSATSLALPDVGTPDAGDWIYSAWGNEGGSVSIAIDDGTEFTNLGGGSDCRTILNAYDADSSDETPSVTWTGDNGCGGIGFILNVAAAAGANPKGPLGMPLNRPLWGPL